MYQRKNANGQSSNNTNSMYSRSGSAGYGRDLEGGRGGGRFNDTNANILEQQNNDRINELSDQVARLKVLVTRAKENSGPK
jgi:blocked early in transport 1